MEYCFGHQEKESKMRTVCRRSMPLFEILSDTESPISFSIEGPIPLLGLEAEEKEQYAHSLPYKLESNGSQDIRLPGIKYEEQYPLEEQKKKNKSKEIITVLDVKPLKLNQQIHDIKEEATHTNQNVPKMGENIVNLVGDIKAKLTKAKSKTSNLECTKKASLKSISKKEAPKHIVRSKSHDDKNVQMKFMKTTYEDPVQCNDINRMAPVKITSMNVEAVKIKDGK